MGFPLCQGVLANKRLTKNIKRCVDVLGAGTGLVVLSPVMLATATAIRVTMGSPVTFRQTRPGLDSLPFELIKFRTMAVDTANAGVKSDAKRLTPLGKWLRAASLDELPTLWNVLVGDMSLVGPRPLLMQYLDRYTPRQARRHCVKPGITGWAQVNGRNALSWNDKFEHDVWYVDNWNLVLDLKILVRTIGKVLRRDGIQAQGSSTMPEFMGAQGVAMEAEAWQSRSSS